MDCRIIQVAQPSDEWLDLRRTRITASRLADVMAKKDTKRYRQYQSEKIKELCGFKGVEESPEWAAHGKENEPRALAGYELKYDVDVEHNLFLISKKYPWLAASPDLMHLPSYNDGGEIKCRALYKNFRQFRRLAADYEGTTRACPASDRHQVQGAMWLTGFKYWYYVNYYIGDDLEGGLVQKVHRVAIPRDQKFIDKMETRCVEFMTECFQEAGLAA